MRIRTRIFKHLGLSNFSTSGKCERCVPSLYVISSNAVIPPHQKTSNMAPEVLTQTKIELSSNCDVFLRSCVKF